MKQTQVEGKVALVTGANRGIGRAIAVELLENGAAKVYACARNTSALEDLKNQYGERMVPVQLDVTNQAHIDAAAAQAGDVDILVNNAGVLVPGNFSMGNVEETLKANFDVNVYGLANVTSAFYNGIKEKNSGAIVNVASVVGLANMPMGSTYSASKAAVHNLTQGIRGELKQSNVLVACVYPGPIDTDMTDEFEVDKDSPENVAKNVVQGIKNGVEDIFPDVMSQQVKEGYNANPKAVEEMFSAWV